jgi:hypothetical protein
MWTAVLIFSKWKVFSEKGLLLGRYGLSVWPTRQSGEASDYVWGSNNLWEIEDFSVKVWVLWVGWIKV